jgi:FkbM family methyltransferase
LRARPAKGPPAAKPPELGRYEWMRPLLPPVVLQAVRDKAFQAQLQSTLETEIVWSLFRRARNDPQAKQWLDFVAYVLRRAPDSQAQLYQDLFVLWATKEKRRGYFVDIGACDGLFLSNTLLLEREYGWRGIVAEPNPIFSAKLRKNRSAYVSTQCVWSVSGKKLAFKQVAEPEYSTLRDIDPQDSHEGRGTRSKFTTVEVTSISLNDLLTKAKAASEIDFLSLDTEGSELEILQATDLKKWKFGHICVEHNFTPRREEIFELLSRHGYTRVMPNISRWDDWYVRARPKVTARKPADTAPALPSESGPS